MIKNHKKKNLIILRVQINLLLEASELYSPFSFFREDLRIGV